jgi:hypothetical protein
MGFFAEAGPMQVFVSNYVRPQRARNRLRSSVRAAAHERPPAPSQLIPEDMSFNSTDEPCYVSTDEMARSAQRLLRCGCARSR